MIRNFLFFATIAALFLVSCSDDKFNASSKPELELLGIVCDSDGSYIDADAKISRVDDGKYYNPYWIIDGELVSNDLYVRKRVSYGEHFLKFFLIDGFEDILSDSCYIRINEPLRVTLLSPIEKYEAAKTDTIIFQYKISGIDTWEENPQTVVYISTDQKDWMQIDSLLPPPFADTVYWRVKAFNEQYTAFSEIRSILWIKK